jgi:hypothetical protein
MLVNYFAYYGDVLINSIVHFLVGWLPPDIRVMCVLGIWDSLVTMHYIPLST